MPDVSDVQTAARARAFAFYLPQFHPIPENDEWWGPGFTEWVSAAAANPLFPGHRQPNLPGELGFYDLRLPETRVAQADLARSHGIEGFCYWHYWFGNDRRILNRVFDEVIETGTPEYPFCLGWANEHWTAWWTDRPNQVLIEQAYPGDDDHRRHFDALLHAFHDPRYVRVDGRPLFLVYRPLRLPDAARFATLWRQLAEEAGLPGIFLVGQRHVADGNWSHRFAGFDGVLNWQLYPLARRHRAEGRMRLRPDWYLSSVSRRSAAVPSVYSYRRLAPYIPWVDEDEVSFPSLLPNWDNTPRTGRKGTVYQGSTPELFGAQVRTAVELLANRDPDLRLTFVRSWNEWSEGNYLEPDRRFGRGWLEAFRSAIAKK